MFVIALAAKPVSVRVDMWLFVHGFVHVCSCLRCFCCCALCVTILRFVCLVWCAVYHSDGREYVD